jgi:hypothetical protein
VNRFILLALSLVLPLAAWGHGGEDHGAPAGATAFVVSAAPRLSTQTDQFELVGVLEGSVLRLYLDQFGSNTPVAKAQIEVERGSWKALATEVAPAVYTVPAPALAQPGKHALTITVQAGDVTDLMDATLEVAAPSAGAFGTPHTHLWGEWAVWLGVAVLALAAAVLLVARRRHARQGRALL